MGGLAFPPEQRLKRPGDFRSVLDRGKKRHARDFIVFRSGGGPGLPRLGVSVSRKIGGAVVRNRVKRLLRESFRLHWREWHLDGADCVVIAKRGSDALSLHEVTGEISAAFTGRARR